MTILEGRGIFDIQNAFRVLSIYYGTQLAPYLDLLVICKFLRDIDSYEESRLKKEFILVSSPCLR